MRCPTWLLALARDTDRGLALIKALLDELRRRRILAPALSVLDRLASAVRHRARREAYRALTVDLSPGQRVRLDELLTPYPDSRLTHLGWLRQAGGAPNPANILKGIGRLTVLRNLGIPGDWALRVHQNRLAQTAREGANTDAAHLREFGDERRHATLVAVVLDTTATLTDEMLEMHERTIGREFKKAERRHLDAFQEGGKAINEKVRLYAAVGKVLIEAKTQAVDPFPGIEKLMTWEAFLASVEEAAKLAGPEDFDHLALVGNGYSYIRRYAPGFLDRLRVPGRAGQRGIAQGDSSAPGSERQGCQECPQGRADRLRPPPLEATRLQGRGDRPPLLRAVRPVRVA